jgi:hypothetical protein
MWREPLAPRETLQLYVTRLILKLGMTTESFELVQNENTRIGERAATLIRFRYLNPEAEWMEQTMALISAGNERERFIAIFSVSCPEEAAEPSRAVFSDVLQSVRVDSEQVSSRPHAVPSSVPERAPDVDMNIALPPMPGSRGR